jgi:hypothetical protein
VQSWRVEVSRLVLAPIRRVMLPRSGASLGRGRRWLLAGTRLSTIAIGVCLVIGVRQWYVWVVVGAAIGCLVADLPLAYMERRGQQARRVS